MRTTLLATVVAATLVTATTAFADVQLLVLGPTTTLEAARARVAALPHIVERLPTVQVVDGGAVVVVGVCDRDGLARAEPWAKLTWDDVRVLSSPHTPFAPDNDSCPAPMAAVKYATSKPTQIVTIDVREPRATWALGPWAFPKRRSDPASAGISATQRLDGGAVADHWWPHTSIDTARYAFDGVVVIAGRSFLRVVVSDDATGQPVRAELAGLCHEYTTTVLTMGGNDVVSGDPKHPNSWRHVVVKGKDGVARAHSFDATTCQFLPR